MPKAKIKKTKEVSAIPEGMKASDLSQEKRMKLYQEVVKQFDAEMSQTYGISLGVELKFTPKGVFPQMVLVDLLANKNEQQVSTEKPAQTTTDQG